MKNLFYTILTFSVLAGLAGYAMQLPSVEEQKAVNKNTVQEVKVFSKEDSFEYLNKIDLLTQRYIENIRTCEKAHFKEELNLFGFNLNFSAVITGWSANKCVYDVEANIGGLGKDITEIFDVPFSASEISAFKPHIQCKFSQKDLNLVATTLTENHKQNMDKYRKLIQNPEQAVNFEKTKLSQADKNMIKKVFKANTCQIVNKDELMTNFMKLQSVE